jgi:hypothetical protein
MSIFRPITLHWGDESFTVAPDKVLGLIGEIEEVVTITELFDMSASHRPKYKVVACAYEAALRYAGAKVTAEEIYGGMFAGADKQTTVVKALTTLLSMMVPPDTSKESAKAAPGNALPAARSSSRRRSRAQSSAGE